MGRAFPTGHILMWWFVSTPSVIYVISVALRMSLSPEMVQTGNNWDVTAAQSAGGKSVLIDDSVNFF